MLNTFAEMLIDEIYDIPLENGNIVLRVIVTAFNKKHGRTSYLAKAKIDPDLNIQGRGSTQVEALESLRAGIISQYAPKYVSKLRSTLHFPITAASGLQGSGIDTEVARMVIPTPPKGVSVSDECGCEVSVKLRVSNGNLLLKPDFKHCNAHKNAPEIYNILKDELARLKFSITNEDMSFAFIKLTSDRIRQLEEVLYN